MNKKKEVIELLHKYGQESEMFMPFITGDEFEILAMDLIKLFDAPDVRHSCFKEVYEKWGTFKTAHDFEQWLIGNK